MLIYYCFSLLLVDLYNLIVGYTEQQQANHLSCKLRTFRDHYFACLLFPLSVTVTVLFWGIYIDCPELILPLWKGKYIPVHGFYNHAVHTAPVITSLLESVVTFHLPPSELNIGLYFVPCFTYVCWILWVLLKALRFELLSTFTVFFIILYWNGVLLTKVWWRKELMEIDTTSSL